MKITKKTVFSDVRPADTTVEWMDTTTNPPTHKVYFNNQWVAVSSGAGDNTMLKVENPVENNILLTNAAGQAIDSHRDMSDFMEAATNTGTSGQMLKLNASGKPEWAAAPTGTVTVDDFLSTESENPVQNKVITTEFDKYLKKGTYDVSTAVGLADNLRGQSVDSEAYLIRYTGGAENEVANGVASVLGMEGNSQVWHQLAKNTAANETINGITVVNNDNITSTYNGTSTGTFQRPFVWNMVAGNNHRILVMGLPEKTNIYRAQILCKNNSEFLNNGIPGKSYIFTWDSSKINFSLYFSISNKATVDNIKITPQIFDLTVIFGAGNEPSTVEEFETWLAQHVETKPYYAYNAGTILSAQTLGIKTYGQNLLSPTTKQAKLIPYTWVENGTTYSNQYTIKNIPSGATATFTPDNTGVAVTVDISGGSLDITSYGSGILELSAATANTYVCMKWNGDKDNDVVPYEDHTYDFDVRKVYGKTSGSDTYVQCFPNGMRSAGTAKDTLTASKAVVRIGSMNMGTLTWAYNSNDKIFYASILGKNGSSQNILCQKYPTQSGNTWYATGNDKTINGYFFFISNSVNVKDSSYTDAATFKAAMSGVMLYYELATPITYTDLVYRDGGIDTPLADVLMNITVNNWSMEEQLMTPYDEQTNQPTSIPATIKTQYGMDAVEAIDTLQKTCYFADDVHANLQALLTCINTNCAETLGGTFSVSDTATDKVFEFTFTPNVEPTNEGE